MTHRKTICTIACLVCGLLLAGVVSVPASTEFTADPTWQPTDPQVAFNLLQNYLRTARIAPDRQVEVRDLWWSTSDPPEGAPGLLDRLAACLARTDDRVAELVAFCTTAEPHTHPQEFAWLADSDTPPLVRKNMRLYYARWLVQAGYYDEAISWTDGLNTADVVDPAALLFYRAVAQQQVVQPDEANAAVVRLLERPNDLPERYLKLALLMQQDLAGLKDESLDHIARRMTDIHRRLDQGSAGQRVQDVENGVIASLDKMIKEVEDQLKQQQAAAASAGGQPSATPMQDSHIAELKGPGKVEQRDTGHTADWGNLPPKDREQALQDVGREFPSHYREIIEQYFRRLASDDSNNGS
jgi:tetratricopeptide (TPR) repeat protein